MSARSAEYELHSPSWWLSVAVEHHQRGEYDLERLCLEGAKSAAYREQIAKENEERKRQQQANTDSNNNAQR